MKIGILTQPLTANYGGILQNYALQQVLIRAGYDVETIDWQHDFVSKDTKWKEWLKTTVLSHFNFMYRNKHFLTKKEKRQLSAKPHAFAVSHINTTPPVYNVKGIERVSKEEQFDAYVVGSDQCWRPKYNGDFLEYMFLGFVRDSNSVMRIAYAASFGTDSWEYTEQQTLVCSKLAQRFNLVTVREKTGEVLCDKYLHVKAKHVLDPTLLLEQEDYIKLMRGAEIKEGPLTTYILDTNSQNDNFLSAIEKRTGLNRYEINPKPFDFKQAKNNLSQFSKIAVEDWLSAIYHAKMTVVDSFHGAVFSILFNKPFWVVGNKKRGMARFESLLQMFGLESRMIDIEQIDSVDLFEPINWEKVNSVLNVKREESLSILLNSLK